MKIAAGTRSRAARRPGSRSTRICRRRPPIKVVVETDQGERAIYKSVNTGGSFGASPLRQEIGLGQAKAIQSVEIRWPAPGGTQTLSGLTMDSFYTLGEGQAQATQRTLASFKWPVPSQTGHAHDHK